jgi:hypothetical protein
VRVVGIAATRSVNNMCEEVPIALFIAIFALGLSLGNVTSIVLLMRR